MCITETSVWHKKQNIYILLYSRKLMKKFIYMLEVKVYWDVNIIVYKNVYILFVKHRSVLLQGHLIYQKLGMIHLIRLRIKYKKDLYPRQYNLIMISLFNDDIHRLAFQKTIYYCIVKFHTLHYFLT